MASCCARDPAKWVVVQHAHLIAGSLKIQADHIHVRPDCCGHLKPSVRVQGQETRDALPIKPRTTGVSVHEEGSRPGWCSRNTAPMAAWVYRLSMSTPLSDCFGQSKPSFELVRDRAVGISSYYGETVKMVISRLEIDEENIFHGFEYPYELFWYEPREASVPTSISS